MNESVKKLFFKFDGRIGRQTYWIGSLIAGMAYSTSSQMCLMVVDVLDGADAPTVMTIGPWAFWFVSLVFMLWATTALSVKRWHDRGKSGWWALFGLIPIIGWIWSMVELGFLKGSEGENRFGGDPLTSKMWPF